MRFGSLASLCAGLGLHTLCAELDRLQGNPLAAPQQNKSQDLQQVELQKEVSSHATCSAALVADSVCGR